MKVCVRPYYIDREPVWEDHKEFYSRCVGSGWQKILHDLTIKLGALGWNGQLEQVKEKFGTLRFYWCNNIKGIFGEIAEDVVSMAEWHTSHTCEECGKDGKLRGSGWVVTLCQVCWDKREAERTAANAKYAAAHPAWEAPGIPTHDELIAESVCTCKGDFTCEAHRS